ncbi:hypothetical protein EDEG_01498 [Edhazardia aedis USNM 41457]|uniref:Uncharacterized protein n=1 Tax=Edhazardia aedis (strain USNM 41457) TaxID=1003232 RepID=J9DSC8_EDHAE|nr:hypothetical protein EDEG_01498 [Edhazardia aedis USNM 41457]|eukprot:EJW04217.1 hypothetical protein EDEG_01498 [Edhazardia aedis USNM 41457]
MAKTLKYMFFVLRHSSFFHVFIKYLKNIQCGGFLEAKQNENQINKNPPCVNFILMTQSQFFTAQKFFENERNYFIVKRKKIIYEFIYKIVDYEFDSKNAERIKFDFEKSLCEVFVNASNASDENKAIKKRIAAKFYSLKYLLTSTDCRILLFNRVSDNLELILFFGILIANKEIIKQILEALNNEKEVFDRLVCLSKSIAQNYNKTKGSVGFCTAHKYLTKAFNSFRKNFQNEKASLNKESSDIGKCKLRKFKNIKDLILTEFPMLENLSCLNELVDNFCEINEALLKNLREKIKLAMTSQNSFEVLLSLIEEELDKYFQEFILDNNYINNHIIERWRCESFHTLKPINISNVLAFVPIYIPLEYKLELHEIKDLNGCLIGDFLKLKIGTLQENYFSSISNQFKSLIKEQKIYLEFSIMISENHSVCVSKKFLFLNIIETFQKKVFVLHCALFKCYQEIIETRLGKNVNEIIEIFKIRLKRLFSEVKCPKIFFDVFEKDSLENVLYNWKKNIIEKHKSTDNQSRDVISTYYIYLMKHNSKEKYNKSRKSILSEIIDSFYIQIATLTFEQQLIDFLAKYFL